MTPRSTSELLTRLRTLNEENLQRLASLRLLPPSALHLRPRPKSWNALECAAHLNKFFEYYGEELRRRIDAAPATPAPEFTSGWLGNKLAAGMKPGPQTRAVSALPSMNPRNWDGEVDTTELDRLEQNLRTMGELLTAAARVNLTTVKVKTALPILRPKIRLGDALRAVVYHDWRHLEQALRAANG